jgi:3-oxoacyl-[acyl-carrier protein] reductase
MKHVVLTGAAGGIGKACIKAFVDRGCRVAAVDIDIESLTQFIQEKNYQAVVVPFSADLRNEWSISDTIGKIIETFPQIEVLVNNAGINKRTSTEETTTQDWQEVLDINLTGAFLTTRYLLPYLKQSGFSRIVNMASRAASRPHRNATPAYGASKAALIYLTRHWALEWIKDGILCFAVAPGPVETDMFRQMDPEKQERTIREIPLGRPVASEEVASLVVYAALDCPPAMTGQTFHCNGATYWA